MNYRLAYALGFHPWEDAEKQRPFNERFSEIRGQDAPSARRRWWRAKWRVAFAFVELVAVTRTSAGLVISLESLLEAPHVLRHLAGSLTTDDEGHQELSDPVAREVEANRHARP